MGQETDAPHDRLTPRQLQLLQAIAAFRASRCYSPTIGELAGQLGISRTTAFEHIEELREKNLLSGSSHKARCLKPTSKAQKLLKQISLCVERNASGYGSALSPRRSEAKPDRRDESSEQTSQYSIRNTHDNTAGGIPLLGRVAAGFPIEAIENTEQLSLDATFGSSDDIFALEVRGDSMIDDGIRNGDYAICRRSSAAQNGQLVIAIVDNENATLKRFYNEKTSARLQPANDDYQPIFSDNCRIQGIVLGLIRKL